MIKVPLILIFTALLLSSCGEFSYKRGASTNDLTSDKKECEAWGGDVALCLKSKGWTVQKLDDLDPFATASVNPDNRTSNPVSNNTYTKKANNTDATSTSETSTSTAVASTSATSSAPTAPADPLDKFIISSWWKIGGNADSLQSAINECVATLGEAHRPNPITNEATRGLGVCMREKGWRGLKAQK